MRLWFVALSLALLAGRAHAQPFALPAPGEVASRAVLETSLTRHRALQPVSVAPDLVVGIRERLAVALHHSRLFDGRTGAGNGLCVIGPRETLGMTPADCRNAYQGPSLSLLASVGRAVTVRVGVSTLDLEPVKLAITAGVITRMSTGRWWLTVAPLVASGVTHREAGNRDRLHAPLYVGATLARGELHVRTGVDTTLQTTADTLSVPVGAGGSWVFGHRWRVGADVTLDRAFGLLNSTVWRTASVYLELGAGGRS